AKHFDLPERRERMLANYRTDRTALCDALERINRAWNASGKTLEHIATLRDPETIAVVSGQQAGLFAGPLYTIYKALSAIKLAECLSLRGIKALPIFWIATEDHDFAEVATVEFINRECHLSGVSIDAQIHADGLPVGQVTLDKSIEATRQTLLDGLPNNEFSDDLQKLLGDAYQPGTKFSDGFARMMAALTAEHGLILLDPLDPELKSLVAPLYSEAAA